MAAPGDPTDRLDGTELRDLKTPAWLRDLGRTAWLLVGLVLLVVGAVWLLSLVHTIVMPLIAAGVIAAVAAPAVTWLHRHRVPRPVGAILLLLALAALAAGVVVVVIGGITSQSGDLAGHLSGAKDTLTGWLADLGVDPNSAQQSGQDASQASTSTVDTLLHGVAKGLSGLSSLLFFLAMTMLCLIFLLADGPRIRVWGERHLGIPPPAARLVTGRILQSLRGYFLGVTIVAAFNAIVVGGGALVFGIPKAGTIAAVTFLGAYIPYLGAWTAGAFAVLVALGGAGTDAAIAMIVIQVLANSVLQQLVQPIAMGAALGIHPLAVLVVTIGGGCLFGAVGLILAAPVTSAVVRITGDLAAARAGGAGPPAGGAPGPVPEPALVP